MVRDPLLRLHPLDSHGLITTGELRRRGMGYEQIIHLNHDRVLQRLLHGVYRLDGMKPPWTQSIALPLVYLDQRVPPTHTRAVLSGLSGLAGRGLRDERQPIPRPLVLVDERCRARAAHLPFDTRHVRHPEAEHIEENGLRLAPIARCLTDAAGDCDVSDKDLRLAVDALRSGRQASVMELSRSWLRETSCGSRRLRAMVEAGHFEQESEGERHAFNVLFRVYPPLPDCQVVMVGGLRVDFVFLAAALIIEYNGRDTHDGQTQADATRNYALESAGNRVITVTRHMLRDPQPLAAHIHNIRRDREQRIASSAMPRPRLPAQPPRLVALRTLYPYG